ncbi:hypothetical protein [Bifidobacterium parmae]|uniref:Uncharacterized protein n=1 Tax=Bifidobacterium parmae TaxID=361854 RepID=A0A2N5J0H6_9BIFI|nr:hypothetical protein [Bifidobacterium parmae]PLS27697.1 hypothetical protein Uis4E_1383 [Bifidobacterium parmae]
MASLTGLYAVEEDSPEHEYLRMCDMPLPQDVMEYLQSQDGESLEDSTRLLYA